MKQGTRIFAFAGLAFLLCATPIIAQAGGSFDATVESNLIKMASVDDEAGMAKWAAANKGLLDAVGPGNNSPIAIAIRNSAPGCLAVLLDSGANPNRLQDFANVNASGGFDFIVLIHSRFSDDMPLMRELSGILLDHGFAWPMSFQDIPGSKARLESSTAGWYANSVPETDATIEQITWLAGKGMDLSRVLNIFVEGSLYQALSPKETAANKGKVSFTIAFARAETLLKKIKKTKASETDTEFAKNGTALPKYYGPENGNQKYLSNPNAFEPDAGYYFANVIPISWMSTDKAICHGENLLVPLAQQGLNPNFILKIEDPALRRIFVSTDLSTREFGMLNLGFDVIVVPYQDSIPGLSSFKLIAMRPAQIPSGSY